MTNIVSTLLERLELGEPATDAGLTVIPLLGTFAGVPEFITLGDALAAGSLVVTEVSRGGAVPSLKAHNKGATGVLILDGEELAGAKQNRVLNTSVYIAPGQKIVIPVSCTEAGRWSYRTDTFEDSGYVSALGVRLTANESVTRNVRASGRFVSDQGAVWGSVGLLQQRHGLESPTSSARDVYEGRSQAVRRREVAFVAVDGQTGLLVLWNGRVAGFDVIGSPEAHAKLHQRLVRSYAMDAPVGTTGSVERDRQTAKEWLAGLASVQVTEHESPGNGMAYRFTGAGVVGSALAVDGAVLHAVALATQVGCTTDEDAEELRFPGFFERRGHFPW